jgi:low temperature requirement protein LtrA
VHSATGPFIAKQGFRCSIIKEKEFYEHRRSGKEPIMKKVANILLGIWLVVAGLISLGGIRFGSSGTLLAVLGISAGILFLLADRGEKLLPRAGSILLGLWLLANGLFTILHVYFSGNHIILAVLAVAAGVLILIRP